MALMLIGCLSVSSANDDLTSIERRLHSELMRTSIWKTFVQLARCPSINRPLIRADLVYFGLVNRCNFESISLRYRTVVLNLESGDLFDGVDETLPLITHNAMPVRPIEALSQFLLTNTQAARVFSGLPENSGFERPTRVSISKVKPSGLWVAVLGEGKLGKKSSYFIHRVSGDLYDSSRRELLVAAPAPLVARVRSHIDINSRKLVLKRISNSIDEQLRKSATVTSACRMRYYAPFDFGEYYAFVSNTEGGACNSDDYILLSVKECYFLSGTNLQRKPQLDGLSRSDCSELNADLRH